MTKKIMLLAIIAMLSACSFTVEVGYHGQTGRDDRTQTQLVKSKVIRAD